MSGSTRTVVQTIDCSGCCIDIIEVMGAKGGHWYQFKPYRYFSFREGSTEKKVQGSLKRADIPLLREALLLTEDYFNRLDNRTHSSNAPTKPLPSLPPEIAAELERLRALEKEHPLPALESKATIKSAPLNEDDIPW